MSRGTPTPATATSTLKPFNSFIKAPFSFETKMGAEKLARIRPMVKTTSGAPKETKAQILERTEREKVKFMRLQFTDILGTIKNVEIPDRQFEEALDGKIMFDGSSI